MDQSIGLIGFGAVARYLVRMLEPFRIRYAYDPYVDDEVLHSYGVERASMDEIFSNCKIISVHAAKTPETYHLVGKKHLESIQDGGLLSIQPGPALLILKPYRGELKKNRFNAVIDVFDEPLPPDSPLIEATQRTFATPSGDQQPIDGEIVTLSLIEDVLKYWPGRRPGWR